MTVDRLVNYSFALILIVFFVLLADAEDHLRIGIALAASLLLCTFAFILHWLTLDGAIAATLFGTMTLGIGGYGAALLLIIFFLTSILLSGKSAVSVGKDPHTYTERQRRDGLQVWANGFWFILFLVIGYALGAEWAYIAAYGALSTATADTWATELGSKRFGGNTYLIAGFERVKAGAHGGISVTGTLGGIAGSLLIALVAGFLPTLNPFTSLISIFVAGFSGCIADSYFGAKFQFHHKTISLPILDGSGEFIFDNNTVNWAATGVGAATAIILNFMLI